MTPTATRTQAFAPNLVACNVRDTALERAIVDRDVGPLKPDFLTANDKAGRRDAIRTCRDTSR